MYTCGSNSVIGTNAGSGPPGRLLWSQPFQKLRMSSDDGARLLWLKFDGDTDVVSNKILKVSFSINLKSLLKVIL